MSEIMTILIAFHQNHYRNFKHFYQDHVCKYWSKEFPRLPSYSRFVEFIGSSMLPLCIYLKHCFGECTSISFIDSTCLHVCHNRRIKQHRVFKRMAARGKTSVDWFFGFKLHLVVNEFGELLIIQITPGNVDDRKPVQELLKSLFGKVFGDRGYVSQTLASQLVIAQLRKNQGLRSFKASKKPLNDSILNKNSGSSRKFAKIRSLTIVFC
jgi:hypothetical protein